MCIIKNISLQFLWKTWATEWRLEYFYVDQFIYSPTQSKSMHKNGSNKGEQESVDKLRFLMYGGLQINLISLHWKGIFGFEISKSMLVYLRADVQKNSNCSGNSRAKQTWLLKNCSGFGPNKIFTKVTRQQRNT